jgi:glycosyltransferase involved in cell wall biosynthesis
MKLGLVARADNGGLGVQTWALYRHLRPARTLVVDIEHLTGYRNHFDRYPGALVSRGEPSPELIRRFLDGLDAVLTCETPYNYALFEHARRIGVKSVLQFNYEFLEYFANPALPRPDLFLAPSLWNYERVPFANKRFLPVPVDRERLPFRHRTRARRFLHVAGHETIHDRNGTELVLAALALVEEPVEVLIRAQRKHPFVIPPTHARVTVVNEDIADHWDLYGDEDDVLLLPRRFGGLSLQLDEALSRGMPAIMTDVSPQNGFLPREWLVPAVTSFRFMAKTQIECHSCDPAALARKIDAFARDPELVSRASLAADALAERIAWHRMAGEYERVLAEVVACASTSSPT